MPKSALILNANNPLGTKLSVQLAIKGYTVYSQYSNQSSKTQTGLLTDLQYLNPELDDIVHPILIHLEDEENFSLLLNVVGGKLDLIVSLTDANNSDGDFSEFKFIDFAGVESGLENDSTVCFGIINGNEISESGRKMVSALIANSESKLSEKPSFVKTLNLIDYTTEKADDSARLYVNEIERSKFKVNRISSITELLYCFVYYLVPIQFIDFYYSSSGLIGHKKN